MSGMLSMLCVILILSVGTTTVRAGLKCDAVRPYFESQGFPVSDIPKEAISCKHLLKFLVSSFLYHTFEFQFGEFCVIIYLKVISFKSFKVTAYLKDLQH